MERKAAAVSLSAKATLKVRSAILIFISSEVKSVSSSLSSAGVVVTVSPSCSIGSSEQETQPGTTTSSRMGNQKRNFFIILDLKRYASVLVVTRSARRPVRQPHHARFLPHCAPRTNMTSFAKSDRYLTLHRSLRPPQNLGIYPQCKIIYSYASLFYTHYSNNNPNYRTSQALQPVFPKHPQASSRPRNQKPAHRPVSPQATPAGFSSEGDTQGGTTGPISPSPLQHILRHIRRFFLTLTGKTVRL